ncbi:Ig-like domain-containing protein [Glycomyces sp. A-F 0318]|uniref:Ig-like domain-containing protein n=1 Tax=Glycomyces amatae TaxID=2881355 RepID=UPI001E474FA2|nr:Ig-like domain-containing protein [Glycomyces amatae]MCD0445832.1 Ig-like domain-containing protein [Glycomyces amatae]
MTATPRRTSVLTKRQQPPLLSVLIMTFAALATLFAAPATAAPAPAPPSGTADVGTFANDNPIDWTQVEWFINYQGDGFPLRVGQHDDSASDGFGERHIIDGHGAVPAYEDIQEAVADPTACWYTVLDERWRCYSGESLVFVVYTTQIDDRSGDSEPFGIITAYYKLPPGTCGRAATTPALMQCDVEPLETSIDYRGPDHVVNGDSLEVSARLGDDLGIPKTGQPLTFSLGTGADRQTCEATTASTGVATCTIDHVDQPAAASVPLTVEYAGNTVLQPSSTVVDLALQTPTSITFTGPEFIANGDSATLAAVLTDYQDHPVAGAPVALTIGTGAYAQTCTGTTDATGEATCAIEAINQVLNEAATLPASAVFAGTSAYVGSDDTATVKLEYYTGRAYGMEATIDLLVLPVEVPSQPDTGELRTAAAATTEETCTAQITAVVLTLEAICASATTTLTPGTITTVASTEHATIGLPGLPVIDIAGLTTTATATCEAVTGSTSLTLSIGGVATPVPTTPNTVIDIAAGVRLTLNEQVHTGNGITVTGARLNVAGTDTDVVLGYSTAAVHHCAP